MPRNPTPLGWKWIHALSFIESGRNKSYRDVPGRRSTALEMAGEDVCVTYHDTCVVRFNQDGTFVLNTGSISTDPRSGADVGRMPTPTTARRITEFSPASVSSVRGVPALDFRSQVIPANAAQYMIEGMDVGYHELLWPEVEHMHVDEDGNPILETLFEQFLPSAWKKIKSVQAWAPPVGGEKMLLTEDSPEHQVQEVRRSWGNYKVLGTVGTLSDGRVFYQVIENKKRSIGPSIGFESSLEAAKAHVDRGLQRRGWSTTRQPTLNNLFRDQHVRPGSLHIWEPEWLEITDNWSDIERRLGRRKIVRMHLANPWTTRLQSRPGKTWRGWLPNSKPWPGLDKDVRFWFELEGGTALGFKRYRKKIHPIVRSL